MDPMTGAAIIGAGASLASGLFGASSARSANKENRKTIRMQQQWQEDMSNTAHQRQTADMRAAGLNPMLSAMQGGASTGSSQLLETKPENDMQGLESAVQSAIETRRLKKEMDAVQSQVDLNKDQANKIVDERDILNQNHKIAKMQEPAIKAETNARKAQAEYLENQAKIDKKFQTFDSYEKRVNNVIQGVSNATGILNPLKGLLNNGNKNSAKSYRQENYDARGEHRSTYERTYRD